MSVPPPPREASRQPDGSFILQQEDGSTLRWTKRPDGTWRKPEHKKAGWVGDLEQAKYVSRGAQLEQRRQEVMHREVGGVPGMPPGAGPAPQAEAKTAAQRKNERKKEQRREQAERKEVEQSSAPIAVVEEEDDARPRQVVPESWDGDAAAPAPAKQVASQKALEKKLRQIADLEARRARGEALGEDQLAKVAAKAQLEAELGRLVRGGPAEAPEAPPSAEAPPPAKVSPPAAEAALQPTAVAAAGAPAPNRKALEKKLKQISDLEEKKAKGEVLNADQAAKLASRPCLEAELRLC